MTEIERAGVKDHGTVTGLLLDLFDAQGWEPEVDRDRWDRVLAELLNSDGWLFLLAREDSEPVGLAAVNWYLTLYGSREKARLSALFVDEESRRRGIGSALMDSVLGAARRRGCAELEIRVNPQDTSTIAFYQKFNPSSELKIFTWKFEE
jgi:GNAT superfamily N-acetyltransferase